MYVAKSKHLGDDQWKINFMNEFLYVVRSYMLKVDLALKKTKDLLLFLVSDGSFLVGI